MPCHVMKLFPRAIAACHNVLRSQAETILTFQLHVPSAAVLQL